MWCMMMKMCTYVKGKNGIHALLWDQPTLQHTKKRSKPATWKMYTPKSSFQLRCKQPEILAKTECDNFGSIIFEVHWLKVERNVPWISARRSRKESTAKRTIKIQNCKTLRKYVSDSDRNLNETNSIGRPQFIVALVIFTRFAIASIFPKAWIVLRIWSKVEANILDVIIESILRHIAMKYLPCRK